MSKQSEARMLAGHRPIKVTTRKGVVIATVTCDSWDDAADILLAFRSKDWTARYGTRSTPTVEAEAKP